MRCFAYCTATEYNLDSIKLALQKQHPLLSMFSNQDYVHARFLESSETSTKTHPEVFFFKEGSVVMWNTTEAQDESLLLLLRRRAEIDSYEEQMQDEEEMKFFEDSSMYV